ncbi:MAG: Ig-like domain repeat protein, partial [Spirochaetaceae bacterium]|nr:Ig-like domain repeat protein [Spirochaetaceae bacterium]
MTTYNKNASTNYLALLTGDGRIDLSVTRKYVGQNQTGSGVSTTSRILNVRQDNTLPEISIKETSALDKTYIQFTASATDTISGLDHNSWQYSINGGALTNGKTLRLTVQAFYNIVFYVKDIVGNQNSKSLAVVFDVEGPIISITNPIDGVWSNANSVTVSATATDNVSGVNESTWNSHVNAEGWNTAGPHNKQRTITAEGSSTVYFVVEDNVGTYTGNHTAVKLDHTPPEITLTGNTDNAWIPNISRTLSAAVVDRLSGVASLELSSDGGLTWQTAEDKYKFSTAYTSEGSHNMIFKARDNVGYETRVTGRVNIDRQAPIISNFTAPIGWIKPNYIFSGVRVKDSTETTSVISGVDGGWAQVAIVGRTTVIINPGYNASAGVLNDFSLSSYLSDGVHDLTLSVRDNAGNIGRSTIKQVQVDGTPPSFNYNINGTVYRQGSGWIIPILFSGISEEHSGINTQGWKYYIDNGTMASFTPTPKEGQYTAEIYQGILSPGNHSIAVCGVDNAGNEAIVRRNFTVDADAPVITSDSLFKKTVDLAEWTNSGSFLLSAADTGSGLASFTAEVKRQQSNGTWEATGDANLSEGKLNFAAGTADGLFQILVQAVDFAKNSVGETFYAKIDRTMPAITLPSGISGSSTVSARGSDAASGLNENTWEWRPETGNWQPGKTAVLSEGRDRKFTFRVRDNAGNGAEKSGEITIDMGAPEVGALVPDYAVGGFLGVTGLYARDVLTAIKKITYQIDGNTEQELDPSSGSAAIPAGGLPEGSHRIRFNAVDSAGNTGQSAVYPFIVDKTAPVIGGIEIRDGRNKDRILEPFDYTAENEIQIRLDGQDQYRDTQGGSSAGELYNGIIRAWHWKLSREKITTAEWQETGTSEAAEFTISGLAEGINYIYLYAEDSGGNRSTVTERIVLKDSTIPGAPRIRSTTHREARRPEQADFLPEAIFRFTPAYNILSGTSYYRWQLKKVVVIDEVGRSFEDYLEGIADNPDEAGEERLFLSLEDNLENEFYRLSVQGVAGNGVTGNSGEYQFRIDSTAPNEIHIRVKPQVQSDNWYNDYDALITWNKPADMTGVAEYRYFLSADEDWTAPTPETIENYDLGNWKKTIEPAEEVNIKALLEDSLSGRIRIVVCAIDYAGNRRMGTETIQSDFEPPRFEPVAGETGLEIGDIETELGKAKRIAWGKLADNESGVDYITLFIKGDTFSRSFVLPPERDSFIADRLFDNDAYVVLVSGYDRAGNKAELVDVFVTGEREKPLSFEAPYREIVGGYTLWGKRIIGSEPDRFTDITLELPETLFINETKESVEGEIRERVKTIPFEEIEVAGTVIKGGAGREGKYTAELDGFVLEGGRLSFDRDSGLAITGGTYTRPVRLQGSARQHRFDMGTVLFGASAAPHFSSDTGSIEEAAGIETYSTDQALGTVPGFSLSKVETLQLRSGKEWFDGTGIAVYAELPAMGRHIVVANPGGGGEIELINGRAEAESRNVLGQLRIEADKPLRLLLGETEYALKKAGVRGHCIDVYEAILNLPEGYEPRELVIRNFSIDGQNGLVIKGPDFYVDPLRIPNPHGGIFESQVIEFTPDGSLYVSGAITSDIYGSFQVDLLRLDNNGADWETGARLRGFTAMVHGFAVSAADARFTGQGIYIANGSIDLHGMGRQFTGLGLRITRRDDVYESALITDSYSVQTGYGEPLGINGGSINPAGVFGRVSAPLGTGITDAANSEVWEFIETQFDPQGTMRGVLPGTREISIADHTLLAGEITLLGSLIRIGRLESQSIPGLDGDIAVFNELFFNEGGIVTAGTTNGTEVFLNAGWRIEYNNLILDSRGIGGRAYLKLPEQLGNLSIEFPDSLLSREGSFISGKAAAGYETALVYGVPVRLEAAVLESREGQLVLHCGSPVVSLSSIDGPELRFGETSFDFNGTLVQGMKGSERVRFVSSNGYRVDAASYAIGKDGIYLDGKIGAQWWNDEDKVDIGGKGIHLLPDLGVTGTGVWDGTTNSGTGRLLYQYANWPVRGGEFNFEYSRIRAGSNRIMFRGIEIELGVIQYNIRGISEGTTAIQQDIELPAINGIVVRLTETRFSHDGLEAGFSVGFPENLGGYTLHFDKINLESNGNFYVTKNIDQYQFTAGGFHFSFEKITFDSRGLYAGLAEITLPAALEQAAIRINGIRVSGSGITIENSHITPVKFWGIEFSFEDFSIKDNLVYFTGNLSLPEKLSGIIPVKPPEIRNFTVGLDGQVHHFDVRINGDYTIPFLETWNLSISDPYMEYTNGKPWVTMYNAKLLFPAGYQVREALIEKVRFNLLTGSFDYSNITANMDIRVSLGGIEFVLQNLYVSSNLSIAFNGFAQMPSFPGVPGFIAGKTLIVDVFEIRGDGSLGAISAELTDLEGEIIPGQEGFLLKNGTASIIKQGNRSVLVSIGGKLKMTSIMPAQLAGNELTIDVLTFDMAIPAVTQIKAEAFLPNPVFFGVRFSQVCLGIDWNAANQNGQFALSGGMIFPNSFPEFLAGQIAEITDFVITFDGVIKSFGAIFVSPAGEAYNAFGSVQVSDLSVMALLENGIVNCDLSGIIILPEGRFPEGIGGLKTAVRMSLDTSTGLKTLHAAAELPDKKLFGAMGMRGVKAGIHKEKNTPAVIQLSGDLLLPDTFPVGLRGMGVSIRQFTMDTTGKIIDLDIGASNIGVRIFNTVELKNASMNFRIGGYDEFLIDINGTMKLLPTSLPQSLRDAELVIGKLELSTRYGLNTFDAGINSAVSFNILGGIRVGITSMLLTESYISLNGDATLPSNYPIGLANTQIDLKTLKMGWNGDLIEIEGGIGALQINLAGFTATIKRLYFEKDDSGQYWVSLESCKIQLPYTLGSAGGEYITLKNARFNPRDGSFMGDIETTHLNIVIAGFRLELITPSIEFTNKRISCERAVLHTPAFLGNAALILSQLTISSDGSIKMSGGGIKLPAFNAGGLQFSNIGVYFELSGSQYIIGGGGSVFIPGAGTVGAILTFADRSDLYPLGFKQAEFSYTLAAGGIPLGTTGLFINGLSGGITYGPPSEVPQKVQGMFGSKGPRLKLGISIGDGSGGRLIDIKPVTWVDINNAAWAFQGDVTLLRGTLNISGNIVAALSRVGFYSGMEIAIKFVRGGIEFYIFDKSGKVIFSGEGYVQFGLAKGAIVNTKILFIPIIIPAWDMWLASINAEFGQFTNGATGFKGTVDVPVLGTVGAFVGSSGIDFGNVSGYRIEKPDFVSSSQRSSRRVSAANQGVVSNDAADRDIVDGVTWQFYIPPAETAGGISPAGNAESGLDRVVLLMAYVEGDPVLSITDPSGRVYGEGKDDTKISYMENAMAFTIPEPRAGLWQIRLSGIEEEAYRLQVFGNKAMPVIEF